MEDLDERIRAILIARLEELLQTWITEFTRQGEGVIGKLITHKTVLEVKIQNQMITLDPPIAEARAYWYRQLHEQLEVVCGLQKVEANRYDRVKPGEQAQTKDKTYQSLILKMSQQ